MGNSSTPGHAKQEKLIEIVYKVIDLIVSEYRKRFIVEVVKLFCPPLTRSFIAKKFGYSKQYIGQLLNEYHPKEDGE